MRSRNADFFCAVVIVGLLAGLAGLATTLLLRSVEHLTYHYAFGSLFEGVAASSPIRRALGPVIGGAIAGSGWWLLRSRVDVPPLAGAIARGDRIPLAPFGIDAAVQIVAVGSGASLGREGAPRQLAAALGDIGIGWLQRLSRRDREILLACAAGAGLAAVYAVPIGGALFAARVMLKTWNPKVMGTALISSSLAAAVSSVVTHYKPVLDWPSLHVSFSLIGIALLLSPLTLAVGTGFNRLMNAAVVARIGRSWRLIPAIAATGALMGLCSQWLPELPGNGKSVLAVSLDTNITILAAAVILVLKPALTGLYLRSGATGGLLTPALATGAATGSIVALTVNSLTGTQLHVPAIALAGAAGVLAITQKAPLWAAMFVWEIARPPIWLHLVFLTSAFASDGLRRWLAGGGGVRAKSRAAVP
ncbi:chloride channel protein [Mycobacterium sp.]|uniref:chloride channel protein n=1 Tax=Mycobacterium sp. TaxID=1785 RepID=UPI0031D2DD06